MDSRQKERLFPSVRPSEPRSIPLSILDATVARFSPTGAIWMFDTPTDATPSHDLVSLLRSSLVSTLNFYPHWAGQLQWAPIREDGGHCHRFNRPMVSYGALSDPGAEFAIVHHDQALEGLVPTAAERIAGKGAWLATDFRQQSYISDTQLALYNLCDYDGLPSITVQVNTFACGSYAIGVQLAHPLADAQALMVFMHQWAATSREQRGHPGKSVFGLPVFDPAKLDSHAAGNIDSGAADDALISLARAQPMHRYDWWETSAPGYPKFLIPTTEASKPPAESLARAPVSPSTSLISPPTAPPWHTWEMELPVSHVQLHFTPSEILKMRRTAMGVQPGHPVISRLDSLLAHLWGLINRARRHSHSDEPVYLNVSLGVRARVSPPLPDSFIGSPIILGYIQAPGSVASQHSLGEKAAQIRKTLQGFTPDVVAAVLHDAAHEISPQRLWQAFAGNRHTLVTSWMRLQVYDVDFIGTGKAPRYVHAAMPKIDGCVQLMDTSEADGGGFDISLYLETEAMKRLLADESLRAYA
ncbi:hypothetical protein FQN49_006744 [Arthroderma sp. PD_2]|nr:hypothetical protein FQN49_006744 [Arthroderma sp. PD_2]